MKPRRLRMRRKRHTSAEIVRKLRDAEVRLAAGLSMAEGK
jgi:hypothetical protein